MLNNFKKIVLGKIMFDEKTVKRQIFYYIYNYNIYSVK